MREIDGYPCDISGMVAVARLRHGAPGRSPLSRSAYQRYIPRTDTGSQPVDRDVSPGDRGLRMYARVVVYTHQDDKAELEAKARAGVIPIVTSTPGYISYGVIFEDDKVVSISQWESEEHAKAADAALTEWVKANTTMTSQTRITGDFAWLELASS
ncbi:MAG: antibiotic biosynthesis monooxygenase [Actinomycetota bacterium]|nr:antibiotic biosynthesis monooxygenase [Actinomycetota bacterium]